LRKVWRAIVPASVAFVTASLALWLADNAPPIEFRGVSVRSEAVPRGGALLVEYQIEQRRECPGVVQRLIVDSLDVVQIVEPQQLLVQSAATGKDEARVTVAIPVPTGAAPGPARYQALIRFRCNPLHTLLGSSIDVETPVVHFHVLPNLAGQNHTEPILAAPVLRRISHP